MFGQQDKAEDIIAETIQGAEELSEVIDLNEARLSQREALLTVCDRARLWRSFDGDVYVTVPVGTHVEHYALSSRMTRNWMLSELARRYTSNERPASAGETAVRDARMFLEARALFDNIKQPLALRVAEHNGAIYFDRGTPDWSVIEVSSIGCRTVGCGPVPILRSKRTGAFPELAPRGDFTPLRQLLSHLSKDDFILFLSWCLGAMFPTGPYPVLILGGEQGSGKTTLARLARRLTDPTTGDLLQPPRDDRDLIAAARHNWVLAFDNLSVLKSELADSICRLATGSEIGGRELFSDHELASFSACRPVILNGIPDLAARGDLADRSVVLRLGPLSCRMTERDWRHQVDAALPLAFSALLDALSTSIRRLESVSTPNVRMADFARLIVAAEPALPWTSGEFLTAYGRSRAQLTATLVEGDLVANTLKDFITGYGQEWSGLMSQLWTMLGQRLSLDTKRAGDWPGNARWFSDRLTRAKPMLRAIGIAVYEQRDAAGVHVSISHTATPATRATGVAQPSPSNDAADVADVANVANGQLLDGTSVLSRT